MLDKEQQTESRPTPAASTAADSPRLTQDELAELLNDAIRRSGRAEVQREQMASLVTLEDALEIAREAGIPREQVLAAAEAIQRRRLRGSRRELVRKRRAAGFFAWAGVTAVGAIAAALFSTWVGLAGTLLVMGLPALYLAWRWLFAPIPDEEADRSGLAPVLGICQVCGRPAVTPRSTLCAEHTYQHRS